MYHDPQIFELPTEKDGFPKVKFENSPSGHHRERKNYKPVSKCKKNWGLNGTCTTPKNMGNVPGQTWDSDSHLRASHQPASVEHNLSGSEESHFHAKEGFAVTGQALPFDQMASNFMEMHLDDCPGGGSIAPVLVLTRPQMKDADDSEAYTQQIFAYLEDMDFTIEKARNDYSYYGRVCIDTQEFSHVVEIYGYPPMFNRDDMLDAFIDFREEGLTIKRVDNTHALGIFSSESAALRALSIRHPLLKVRKLSKGTNKSRAKAVSCAEFIQSMREGPHKGTAEPEGQSC
ncbi:uncharacterized protein [Paramormyrops kingsleyae]|uniref:uncharacterized protein isoform X1 n=1 Tax=Paramormyrops kingsleyae TaxID=1676925 RepID=UPI000CD62863|nr:uncharacterized protein LOC111857552 isoform X1 [Paramormyrops kingsleyae]